MGTTCGSVDRGQVKTEAAAEVPTQDSGGFESTAGVTGCLCVGVPFDLSHLCLCV